MTPIAELQNQLEATYEVAIPYAVVDFLTHNTTLLEQSQSAADHPQELLIVAPNADGLDVALYLHPDVINHLAKDCPLERLHDGNLQSFCLAAEGVSHFLYLTWRAAQDDPVSCVELELQAEVDKFVCAWALLEKQSGETSRSQLRRSLFERVRYSHDLATPERIRYEEANRLASKYCHHLDERYLRDGSVVGFFAEIRRFYRLTHHRKLRYVDQIAG